MKLVPVGIDPDHIEFTTDYVSVEPFDGSLLKTHWLFYYVVLKTKPQFKKNYQTWKMKLVLVGIDPDHIEFTTDHVSVEPFDGSLLKTHWLFYYVVLETKPQFKKNYQTWKMKLVSVGIDPDRVGFAADHVTAELFDLQWPINWLTRYKCEMFTIGHPCLISFK